MNTIIFVINQLGGIGCGGADRVVATLANALCKYGYPVGIIALTDNRAIDRELDTNVQVRFLGRIEPAGKIRNLLRIVSSIRTVKKEMVRQPDAIFISFINWVNMCTLLARGRKAVKVIVSERTDPSSEPASSIMRKLRDILYKEADGIVFQTVHARDYFHKPMQSRRVIIANPMPDNLPTRCNGDRRKEIVCLSRLETQKNIPLLIESFAKFKTRHPEYILKVYGRGKLRDELIQIVHERGLDDCIDFAGFVPDACNRIINSGMFVLSSDFEGMSNSMLEALVIGIPVIATDCPAGAAKELIASYKNGILVPMQDSDAMCDAMCFMAEHPLEAERMAAEAQRLREEFSVTKILGQWIELIDNLEDRNEQYQIDRKKGIKA